MKNHLPSEYNFLPIELFNKLHGLKNQYDRLMIYLTTNVILFFLILIVV